MNIIKETMLDEWVDRNEREAQEVIVDLVARLVKAQCPRPKVYRFPKGDSIGQTGVDGLLEVNEEYQPFITAGISVWEIGTGRKPQDKITSDYNKRYREISKTPTFSQTTFVFVTPRSAIRTKFTIKKQDEWKRSRANDGWKDIKIVDATILCDWISRFPAICGWLYQIITHNECEIISPQMRWSILESIPSHGKHALTPEVFLCGRDKIISTVKTFLQESELGDLNIQTRYPNHLPDFISALIKNEEGKEGIQSYDNVLLIDDAEKLPSFVNLEDPHVFVLGEEGDLDKMPKWCAQVRQKGHRLIRPKSWGGKPGNLFNVLLMPSASELQRALENANFPPLEAQHISAKANGNIPILLRLLNDIYGSGMYWGDPSARESLALVSLIGEWNDRNIFDVAAVESVTGKKYEEWKKQLALLPVRTAAPLHLRSDGNCYFVARYEGWLVGGSIFTQQELEHFFGIVERVLLQVASSALLDPWQKLLATSDGAILPSDGFVHAMVEGLSIMATNANFWENGPQSWIEMRVAKIVESVLSIEGSSAWVNLNSLLPLLAEAAPQIFLKKLAEQVTKNSFLSALSCTEVSSFTRPPICGILWALEALSWFPEWLPQVVTLLGDLSLVELPQNYGNRPEISLKEVFAPWRMFGAIDSDLRPNLLEALAQKYPRTAWKVLLAISPWDTHSISLGVYMPHWLDASEKNLRCEADISSIELVSNFERITSPALQVLLQDDLLPLEDIIQGIRLIPQAFQQIITLFRNCKNTSKSNNAWELLSKSSVWRLERNQLNVIEDVLKFLVPVDKYEHIKIYFGESIPNFNFEIDQDVQLKQWKSTQEENVKLIFDEDGLPGILRLVSMVKVPSIIGQELAKIADEDVDEFLMLSLQDSSFLEPSGMESFIGAYIRGRHAQCGASWLKKIWSMTDESGKLKILFNIPFSDLAWELVEQLSQDSQFLYWQKVAYYPCKTSGEIGRVIEKMVMVRRGGDALRWLYYMTRYGLNFPREKAMQLLLEPDDNMMSNSHIVYEVIKYLHKTKQICDDVLSDIELCWIELFSPSPSGEVAECLNKRLLSDAEYFSEVICAAYKPKQQKHLARQSEGETLKASICWRALNQLRAPAELSFAEENFSQWVNDVLKLTKANDRFEVAFQLIGKVLFHAPSDPSGLWINKGAAKFLDTYKEMQIGFAIEAVNSRGVFVMSGGEEEIKIASQYEDKAHELRKAKFYSFAHCVDKIVADYKNQAKNFREKEIKDF
ncbi:hypothetical protein [Desulfovibrio sp.]|uniref:hypothetical protein n=1 Tax=Desulfovibrio sp. TaxID=885 RepID=UPI0025C6003F|nr:hypothetical protein [Desulfovibrio sp.]